VQVHVVPAVIMHRRTAPGAFEQVAGLYGDSAGGMIARRMAQFQAVKADLLQRPHRKRRHRAGRHASTAGSREHPVGDDGDAVIEIEAAQGDPAEHFAVVTGDRPVAALLVLPVLTVGIEPLLNASLGAGAARVPAADLTIGVSGQECRDVGRFPRPQQQAGGNGQHGLGEAGKRTGGYYRRRRQCASHEP